MKNIQKRQVCWYVVLCCVVRPAELQCLYLWGQARPCRQRHYSPLKHPATAHTATHFHISPQHLNLQRHCCENLKSPKTFFLLICKWSEHQDDGAHWLRVSTWCTILCEPYDIHTHTKFSVCRVGGGIIHMWSSSSQTSIKQNGRTAYFYTGHVESLLHQKRQENLMWFWPCIIVNMWK